MRRTLAAPGLAAVLGMALLLTACGKTNAHNNTAGETVSTALFDFFHYGCQPGGKLPRH